MKGWRRRDDEDDEDGGVEVEALDDEAFPLPQPPVNKQLTPLLQRRGYWDPDSIPTMSRPTWWRESMSFKQQRKDGGVVFLY